MVINCSIPGCRNTQSKKNYSFFTFPKEKFYRDAWLNVCSKKLKAIKYARICSAHFRPECFKPRSASLEYIDQMLNKAPRRILKLNATAIPTENLTKTTSVVGEIEDNEPINEYLSEMENNLPEGYCSSEEINIASEKISASEITNDNTNLPDDISLQFINVSEDESLSQTTDVNYDVSNESEEEESSKGNKNVIDRIFSVLPECNFATEEERKHYLKRLEQIKKVINVNMMELQADVKQERQEKEIQVKQIETLKREKRKQYNDFLLKFLQVKKNKMYWKKECLAYKIKLYQAENKD